MSTGVVARDDIYDCVTNVFTPETLRVLDAANTPESLLLAAGFADYEQAKGESPRVKYADSGAFRAKALRLAPNDEMVLTMVANRCSPRTVGESSALCTKDVALRLTELDPNNGFYWATLAHYELGDGNVEVALKNYQRAAGAQTFSTGWGEQVYRLANALKEILVIETACASTIAAGYTGASLPPYQEFTNTCRTYLDDQTWRQACLDLGYKMETKALTFASRRIGFPLQRIVYGATQSTVDLAAVDQRKEQLQSQMSKQSSLYACLFKDSKLIDQWLLSLRDYEEVETTSRFATSTPDC
ncbi:MAG: hypothetical protein AAF098_16320 [Pseudomonadota bacterium]